MGWNYRKRVRLGRGGWANISKSGISFSQRVGPVTFNSRGRRSVRVGPGLSYRSGCALPMALFTVTAIVLLVGVGGCGGNDASTSDARAGTTTTADMAGHDMAGHDHGDGGPGSTGSTDDLGLGMLHNGHHEDMQYTQLDEQTQARLDRFVALSRTVADAYPTLGAMHAAGGRNAGPFSPGLGLHVSAPWPAQGLNPDGVVDADDAAHPMMAIYDGTTAEAKIAGFMYYSVDPERPEGFPGSNDYWHFHTDVCMKFTPQGTEAPFGADRSTDKAQCDEVGGVLMAKTQWMVHVWSVPGYEVPPADGGIFAEVNPKLTCADGTYFMMDAKDWPDHPTDFCRAAA